MRRMVKVNECVAHRVPEGMVNGTTAFVPDSAFVERNRVCSSVKTDAKVAEEKAEMEENGEEERSDGS